MKKLSILLAILCLGQYVSAQIDTAGVKIDKKIKAKLIYMGISDQGPTQYTQSDGTTKSGTNRRKITIGVKQGPDGNYQRLDKKGDNLLKMLKSDPDAVAEFNKAFEYRKKAKQSNLAEIGCEIGAVVLAGVCIVKTMKNKNLPEGEEPSGRGIQIASGVGAVGLLGAFYYFYFHTEKMLDSFIESLQKSVDIYNQNMLEEALSK